MKKTIIFSILLFFTLSLTAQTNDTLSVRVQIGTGGKVSENGIFLPNDTILSVMRDSSKTFTIIPDSAFQIATLTYNGTDVKSKIVDNTYTTPPATVQAILVVTFEETPYIILQKIDNDSCLQVKCNKTWRVTSISNWLTLSQYSGNGNDTIYYKMAKNPNIEERAAAVTVVINSVCFQTIFIIQNPGDTTLNVSKNSLTFAGNPYYSQDIHVTSNTSWTVLSDKSWVKFSPNSSSRNRSVTVKASRNPEVTPRTANLIFTAPGVKNQIVIINQTGDTTISVMTNTYEVSPYSGDSVFCLVKSNTSWSVTSNQTWLKIISTKGRGNDSLYFTTTENNPDFETREANIRVFVSSNYFRYIHVTQKGKPVFLNISDTILTIENKEGSIAYTTVTSNASWYPLSNDDWLTCPSSDSTYSHGNYDSYTLSIRASANKTTNERKGSIWITSKYGQQRNIQVIQAPRDPYPEYSTIDTISMTALQEYKYQIGASKSWNLVTTMPWILYNKESGTGKDTICFSLEANPDNTKRTALAILTIDSKIHAISFTQPAKDLSRGIYNITPGKLIEKLTSIDYNYTTSLTVTGTLNFGDFQSIVTFLSELKKLDLSGSTVVEKRLPPYAFFSLQRWCGSSLKTIILPKSIVSIGENAFFACLGQTDINLPEGIVTIEKEAFYQCNSLLSITFPISLTSIGKSAFFACYNMNTAITLPENVKHIGDEAFRECRKLTEINSLSVTPPALGTDCFLRVPISVVNVQEKAVNAYKADSGWNNFNIVAKKFYYQIKMQLNERGKLKLDDITIDKDTVLAVEYDSSITVAIIPDPGYYLASVQYDGYDVKPQLSENIFTTPIINKNSILNMIFEPVQINPINPVLENQIKVSTTQSEIIVDGTTEGEVVDLYSMVGAKLATIKSHGDRIVLTAKKQSLYIVKTPSKTVKVLLQ